MKQTGFDPDEIEAHAAARTAVAEPEPDAEEEGGEVDALPRNSRPRVIETTYMPLDALVPLVKPGSLQPTAEFVDGVRENGVLFPVAVAVDLTTKVMTLIDGARRIQSAAAVGTITHLSTVVYDASSVHVPEAGELKAGPEAGVAALTLMANYHRSANAVAELRAMETLLMVLPIEEIAKKLRIPLNVVRKRVGLKALTPKLRTAWERGELSTTTAESAAKLPKAVQQKLEKIVKEKDRLTGADVRAVREARASSAATMLPASLFGAGLPEAARGDEAGVKTLAECHATAQGIVARLTEQRLDGELVTATRQLVARIERELAVRGGKA